MNKENDKLQETSRPLLKAGQDAEYHVGAASQNGSPMELGYHSDFPVVGIGSSAGGLEALEQFFIGMPSDADFAFILVSHLAPDHKSLMGELLQKYTLMEISEIKDGTLVKPNCIYIIPPGKDLKILHGTLHLLDPVSPHGFRHPIDLFFRSLAKDMKERAVGIILSGNGTEGTRGVRDVKGEGGMVMVQDLDSAKFDSMPRSAIDTGLADFILPPNEMAGYLVRYGGRTKTVPIKVPETECEADLPTLQKIFALIRDRKNIDFSFYKQNTIIRRIERRMFLMRIDNVKNYLKFVQSNEEEIDRIFNECLIGVTQFFRDPEAFESIKKEILPRLAKNKPNNGSLRVWVPACSTGEEAYSLAIIIREYMSESKSNFRVQIFATDLEEKTIEKARSGLFPESIDADMSGDRLDRFFTKVNNSYKVKEEIRSMIVFAPQNIINEPPFSRLDLISCRNLMIYLGQELQKYLVKLFNYALDPSGFLFLGSSESIGNNFDLFSLVNKKWRIYRQKPGVGPFLTGAGTGRTREHTRSDILKHQDFERLLFKMILDNYSPPCVVIDQKGDIIYLHGRTAGYLEPAPGKARLNIYNMACKGIRHLVNVAVRKAISHNTEVIMDNALSPSGKETRKVELTVKPVPSLVPGQNYCLVIFREVMVHKVQEKNDEAAECYEADQESRLELLAQELNSVRENLQDTIEELEISNEELVSSNEELQSTNEELQSTNEELETSKEELQSLNEELLTVNAELQGKIEELTVINDDMINFLTSTEIATIFIDSRKRIKRFTPSATAIFKLIATDVNRPIGDLQSRLLYDDLESDISRVIEKLNVVTREVPDVNNNWYLMRILPYKTARNVIDGCVMTFSDITTVKRLQKKITDQEKLYRSIFNLSLDGIALTDAKTGKFIDCNPEFEKQTGRTLTQLKTLRLFDLVPPKLMSRMEEWFKKLDKYSLKETTKIKIRRPNDDIVAIELETMPISTQSGLYIHSITRDITRREDEEEASRSLKDLTRSIIQTVREPLLALDENLVITTFNRSFHNTFDLDPDQLAGRNFFEIAGQQWDTQELRELFYDLLTKNVQIQDYVINARTPVGGKKKFLLNACQLIPVGSQTGGILLSIKNI